MQVLRVGAVGASFPTPFSPSSLPPSLPQRELGNLPFKLDSIGGSTSNQKNHIKTVHFDEWFNKAILPDLQCNSEEEVAAEREAQQVAVPSKRTGGPIQTPLTAFLPVCPCRLHSLHFTHSPFPPPLSRSQAIVQAW